MNETWMTPGTSMESTSITPADIRLWFEPSHTLRSEIKGGWCPLKTQLFVSSPLSYPEKFLTLLDGKSEEIAFINHISELSAESRAVAEEAIRQRYLTSRITIITDLRNDFGITYWHVETDRGQRDFVVQSLSESCVWLSDAHILIVDADGCRFEIMDRHALDAQSRALLDTVL